MRIIAVASAAIMASALAVATAPALAATAHNSQAGGYGTSSNAGDPTVGSPHVKHAAKHRAMQK